MPRHGSRRNPHNNPNLPGFNPNLPAGRTPANGTRRRRRGGGRKAQQRTSQVLRAGGRTPAGLLRGQSTPPGARTRGVRRSPSRRAQTRGIRRPSTAGRVPAINGNIISQPQRSPRSKTPNQRRVVNGGAIPNGINRQTPQNRNAGMMMGGTYVFANTNTEYNGTMVEMGGRMYSSDNGKTITGNSRALQLKSNVGKV